MNPVLVPAVLYNPLHRNAGVTLLLHIAQEVMTIANRLEQPNYSMESILHGALLAYFTEASILLERLTPSLAWLCQYSFVQWCQTLKGTLKELQMTTGRTTLCSPPCRRTHKQQGQNNIFFSWEICKAAEVSQLQSAGWDCYKPKYIVFCCQCRNRTVTIQQGLSLITSTEVLVLNRGTGKGELLSVLSCCRNGELYLAQ